MTFIGHLYPIQIRHIRSFQSTEGVTAKRLVTNDLLLETDRQAAIGAWQYIQRTQLEDQGWRQGNVLPDLANSKGLNALTSDPDVLWGLELGWNWFTRMQAQNLVIAQQRRYERTHGLTVVNEDSPYFLYDSVYGVGQAGNAIRSDGKTYPQFRQLSTNATFSWAARFPDHLYADTLRQSVQFLADKTKGY